MVSYQIFTQTALASVAVGVEWFSADGGFMAKFQLRFSGVHLRLRLDVCFISYGFDPYVWEGTPIIHSILS